MHIRRVKEFNPELVHFKKGEVLVEYVQERDMANYKPYRTKAQKAMARANARKVNGTWVSNAPVSRHATKGSS